MGTVNSLREYSVSHNFSSLSSSSNNAEDAANSDDLEQTINYVEIFELVKEVVESGSKNLLETIANLIATKILDEFNIDAISVKISKPAPPLPNINFSSFGVEVFKQKT